MPRDASLLDSKCWNGGHVWVITNSGYIQIDDVYFDFFNFFLVRFKFFKNDFFVKMSSQNFKNIYILMNE